MLPVKIVKFISIIILLTSCEDTPTKKLDVAIEYSSLWDSLCSTLKGYEIKDAWKKEILIKKTQLEIEWRTYGDDLLNTTESIVGHRFNRESATVHLTLCNTPSRSFPLIVNMRYSLSSFIKKPVPIEVKAGTVFHEILHSYVSDNLNDQSALLALYKSEHQRVLDHIHLLALIKAVYLELGRSRELSLIIANDNSLPNGHYKRAWQIVNTEPEYYFDFVNELQAHQTKI